jgi:DNA mismatch repair protein MutS
VGSGDDLSKGQSTFMVEMLETASILNLATAKSFVILDEIGRGTSTWDGLSLAWAVIENIHNKIKCRTLFATHYHELTNLNKTLNKLCLYFLDAKEFNEDIVFLYNLIPGSANKSYGLQVAKLAGMPLNVIERAKNILKNLEEDYNLEMKLPLLEEKDTNINENNKVEEKLKNIEPDNIKPLEALEILYELKKLSDKKH